MTEAEKDIQRWRELMLEKLSLIRQAQTLCHNLCVDARVRMDEMRGWLSDIESHAVKLDKQSYLYSFLGSLEFFMCWFSGKPMIQGLGFTIPVALVILWKLLAGMVRGVKIAETEIIRLQEVVTKYQEQEEKEGCYYKAVKQVFDYASPRIHTFEVDVEFRKEYRRMEDLAEALYVP